MNKYKNTSEKGRRAVKIRWKRLENKLQREFKEIKKKKDYYFHLARLCGFLAGDGSIFMHGSAHYNICFYPDNIRMAEKFVESFKFLYNLTPQVKKDKRSVNMYSIRKKSKFVYLHLVSIAKFKCVEWNIPFKILISKKLQKEWLRAFFDCEAHIGTRQIQVQSVNLNGLKEIKRLLSEFEIESKIYSYIRKNPKHNINYILCIMKKSSREKYLKEIGFNHSEKLKKLSLQCAGLPER